MTQRILIDAVHPEEKRIAITSNDRLQEFDIETASKKQNKGNIYLGKITRVEPSLQAVFVEYGAGRQGFLPFAEVHYDYYQIPVSDKEALIADLEEDTKEEEAEDETSAKKGGKKGKEEDEKAEGKDAEDASEEEEHTPEALEDEAEEARSGNKHQFYRRYKIQEVLKRNQIVLVQVIKDERGQKGAALSTYLSLPGRYCVFMPNNPRGGGVSRRITDKKDRQKMKTVVEKLGLEQGSSIIMRTAGLDRRLPEIRRDYNYLLKQWNDIRTGVIEATAPAQIYTEGDIIIRTLRDLFRNNIDEVVIEGEEAAADARNYLKALSPKDAKLLVEHKDTTPVFRHYGINNALDQLHDNEVVLPSGGSIVIHQTEALVAIDVNSGKATRSRNIEETAVSTNKEAAAEVARQLRLRDLAGLVVIDFIDMREYRNRRAVERAMKDALKKDRARIQVGRISSFGLLEMSRQRMHSSIVESATVTCPHCEGTGYVRSPESNAMRLLRVIEAEAKREDAKHVKLVTSATAAVNLLNVMRAEIAALEEAHGVTITVQHDSALSGNEYHIPGSKNRKRRDRNNRNKDKSREQHNKEDNAAEKGEDTKQPAKNKKGKKSADNNKKEAEAEVAAEGNEAEEKPSKSRRGRRGGARRGKKSADATADLIPADEQPQEDNVPQTQEISEEEKKPAPKKRRGRSPRKVKPEPSITSHTEAANDSQNSAPKSSGKTGGDADDKKLKGLWKKITQ